MADKDFALALKSIVDCYNETGKIKITLREFDQLRDVERVERIERKLYEYERNIIVNAKKYDRLVKTSVNHQHNRFNLHSIKYCQLVIKEANSL